MISLPRLLLTLLAAGFSAFHIVLAVHALPAAESPWPAVVALALYGAVTTLSLAPSRSARMPLWIASLNIAFTVVGLLLVLSQLEPTRDNGYATWVVGAVGTLMTITVVRQRPWFAWFGIGLMIGIVWYWSGSLLELPALGAIGGPVWVGVAHATTAATARAARDAKLFERAEQRAAEWQAQEEAEFYERRVRLGQMNETVAPMLRRIITADGVLDEAARQECLHLEAAMRDEIRGRRLLDDRVRREVLAVRRRGIEVTLLDDGGLDELDRDAHARVTAVIAAQLGELEGLEADRVVVRTGHPEDEVAVTIVGLRDADPALAGIEDEPELALWVEVPRVATADPDTSA